MATQDYYRNNPGDDPAFFDEGPSPPQAVIIFVNTSSIDTSAIDGYRQGVELTQQKHFDAGIVKISAGEPGHVLRRNGYGMSRNFRNDPRFEELDYFSPEMFLRAQEQDSPLLFNIITFPIITSDNDQIENYVFDGIIEPFTIRPRASFFSIDVPFEAHEPKGALMGGNTDTTWASDQVESVYVYDLKQHIGYLDMVDMIDGRYPLNGFFRHDKTPLSPYVDARYPRNVRLATNYDNDLNAALSLMSGSTDNYIGLTQRAATAGLDYDPNGSSLGTDSIAFGGRVY